MPLFSIIMPTFNSARFVAEAIDSVLAQTLPDWELLIVDDASEDDTLAILRDYESRDNRIRVFANPSNLGPAGTRNHAIREASGRYIAFLDSDDIWRAHKLERQQAHFEATGAVLIYSAYEKIDDRGQQQGRIVEVPERINYAGLLNATVIATLTAAYDTSQVGKVLMPDIRMRQDYGLWLAILRRGGEARGLPEPLALLRKRPGSVSSNKLRSAIYTWRVYREIEGLPLLASAWHFCHYAIRAFVKSRI